MRDEINDFTFYFGAASGSARKVLRQMEEPDVMISYTTQNNQPWDCESLFIDSGGYSLMKHIGKHDHADDYLDYVERSGAEYFALQDYPCEPDILEKYDRSVQTHQYMSLEAGCHTLVRAQERGIDAKPVAVLQGWDLEDYYNCLRIYDRGGLMTDYVGIGSVCRRNAAADIREIIVAMRQCLPRQKLHAFGVKKDVLGYRDVRQALDSADSLAYDWSYTKDVPGPRWHQVTHNYLEFKRSLGGAFNTEQAPAGQTTL